MGAVDAPAAGVVQVELQARHAVGRHVQHIGNLQRFFVGTVEVRQQRVGQVDAVGFVQVVEVFVAVDLLPGGAEGVGLMGQAQ
ncbi:hypothetical protein D9M73_173430 [compost metagenome]